MSKIDDSLFETRLGKAVSYGECPKCQSALHIKYKGKSSFLGCSSYPKCDYSEPLHHDEVKNLKIIEDSKCPVCASKLAVKNGRYGMFIGCTNFPKCHYIEHKESKPAEVQYDPVACPKCKVGTLIAKQNKFGKYFYACNQFPTCKFFLNHKPVQQTCKACGYPVLIEKDERLICANKSCKKPSANNKGEQIQNEC